MWVIMSLKLVFKVGIKRVQGSMGDHTIEPLFSGLNSLCCRYTTRWSPGIGLIPGVKILLMMIITT